MTEKEIYVAAINKFGIDNQVDMMIEECAELQKALLKVRREKNDIERYILIKELRDEIVDVSIVLEQMKMIYFDNGANFVARKALKLDRLEKLL